MYLRGLTIATLVALAATPAFAETHISYGSATSPSSMQNAEGVVPWLETAGKLTNGGITYELQAGGSVVTGATALSAVDSGVVDGAGIITSYYRDDLPINALLSSFAFLSGDPRVTVGAMAELALTDCPSCTEEFKKHNVVPFGPYATDTYGVACHAPVKTLGDLKGLRVRSSGAAWNRFAADLGMVPVNLAVGEMYEALQRGTVDCTFSAMSLMRTLSLGEVASYYIDIPVGSLTSTANLALNRDFWNDLSPDERAALLKAAPVGVAHTAFGYSGMAKSVREAAKDSGLHIVSVDPSIQTVLDKFVENEKSQIIAEGEGRKVQDTAGLIQRYEQLTRKWQDIVAKEGDTVEGLSAALDREIYSKVAAQF